MRQTICLALGMGLALALSAGAIAQNVGIDLHGLCGFSFDGNIKDHGKADIGTGWGLGGGLVFNLGEYVKIDAGADWLRAKIKDPGKSVYLDMIPLTAALRVGFNLDQVFAYAGGGAGYSFNPVDWDPVDIDNCPIYFALAGAEIAVSDVTAIRTEFRYNWMKADAKSSILWPDWETNIKLDHLQVRAGLVFYL